MYYSIHTQNVCLPFHLNLHLIFVHLLIKMLNRSQISNYHFHIHFLQTHSSYCEKKQNSFYILMILNRCRQILNLLFGLMGLVLVFLNFLSQIRIIRVSYV